jgi:hypothetical protein
LLKNDTNTRGSSFWFYFKVQGKWINPQNHLNRTVKFNILNFSKGDLKYFYSMGMGVMSSVTHSKTPFTCEGWDSSKCFDLEFFQNTDIDKLNASSSSKHFYHLSFSYTFPSKKPCDNV